MTNVWESFGQGLELGDNIGGQIRNSRAFQQGGLDAVGEAAGQTGDLETMETARGMQRRQRQFQDDTTQRAYERMGQIAPWARNVIRATRNMDPQRAGAMLSRPDIQQRFVDWGFTPEQIQAGVAGLTNEDPAVRAQWADELESAFTQHENPEWSVSEFTGDIFGVDPNTGERVDGGQAPGADLIRQKTQADIELTRRNANAPYAAPGGNGVQYHVLTPQEAQQRGLGPGTWQEGSNGIISNVGRNAVFPADQRARVAIMYEPALEATRTLEQADAGAVTRQGSHGSDTPLGQDWGARALDAVPLIGDAAASALGGEDYQRYVSASSTFESSMLPILSGAAVTPSEATRIIRAALPRVGDSQAVLTDKSRRRRQMLNGAALIGGREPPYPADGIPDWATNAQSEVQSSAGASQGGVGLESMSDEELDQLERELANGGQ